ncbi:hypothetical protein RIF29_30071 [Crotalaria pallida]|uniref:Uncharacterized protein n=1 Tax=Crotalaria pallida TaxID=3830 RepID=A0AAN9EFX8_CROPI
MVVAEAEFVSAKEASLAEVKLVNGLRADFGEVYPNPVRIVSIGQKVEEPLADPDNEKYIFIILSRISSTADPKVEDPNRMISTILIFTMLKVELNSYRLYGCWARAASCDTAVVIASFWFISMQVIGSCQFRPSFNFLGSIVMKLKVRVEQIGSHIFLLSTGMPRFAQVHQDLDGNKGCQIICHECNISI